MNFLIRPDGPSHTPHTRSGAYESKNLPYAPSTFYAIEKCFQRTVDRKVYTRYYTANLIS